MGTGSEGDGDKGGANSWSSPVPFSLSSVRHSLKVGCQETVAATNRALATAEAQSKQWTQSVVRTVESVERTITREGSNMASEVLSMYNMARIQYGPQLVVGSGLVVGGIVALRRGRFTGTLSGLLSGTAVYSIMYNTVTLEDLADRAFSRK